MINLDNVHNILKLQQRYDICFPQALSALVTAVIGKVELGTIPIVDDFEFYNENYQPLSPNQRRMSMRKKENQSVMIAARRSLELMCRVGIVIEFESLLSTQGTENGMLEDFFGVIRCLRKCQVKFVSEDGVPSQNKSNDNGVQRGRESRPTSVGGMEVEEDTILDVIIDFQNDPSLPSLFPDPEFELEEEEEDGDKEDKRMETENSKYRGSRSTIDLKQLNKNNSILVTIVVSNNAFQYLPHVMKVGTCLPVFPLMFSVGINEKQTYANKLGDTQMQDEINVSNFLALKFFYERIYEPMWMDTNQETAFVPSDPISKRVSRRRRSSNEQDKIYEHLEWLCDEMNDIWEEVEDTMTLSQKRSSISENSPPPIRITQDDLNPTLRPDSANFTGMTDEKYSYLHGVSQYSNMWSQYDTLDPKFTANMNGSQYSPPNLDYQNDSTPSQQSQQSQQEDHPLIEALKMASEGKRTELREYQLHRTSQHSTHTGTSSQNSTVFKGGDDMTKKKQQPQTNNDSLKLDTETGRRHSSKVILSKEFGTGESHRSQNSHISSVRFSVSSVSADFHLEFLEALLLDLQDSVLGSIGARDKHWEILALAADLVRGMGGCRSTSCKSAKDRTSMSITFEETRICQEICGDILSGPSFDKVLGDLRVHGVRLENARKNIGRPKFAFNQFQRRLLPPVYRPPACTTGSAQS